jgi:hypothetical protein
VKILDMLTAIAVAALKLLKFLRLLSQELLHDSGYNFDCIKIDEIGCGRIVTRYKE